MNGRIPGVGAAGIDFANVEHPVPAIREGYSSLMLKTCNHHHTNSSLTHLVGLPKAMLSS